RSESLIAMHHQWKGSSRCPVSEVRDTPQRALTRTSETKGHQPLYDSSAAFRFEVPNRVCCRWCRNFKSAALASYSKPPASSHVEIRAWETGVNPAQPCNSER